MPQNGGVICDRFPCQVEKGRRAEKHRNDMRFGMLKTGIEEALRTPMLGEFMPQDAQVRALVAVLAKLTEAA